MVSKIALIVLGLIAEEAINPYEIKKLMEKLNMDKVLPVSSSTIYATINGLVKKRYISGKKERRGKMPEKTVYSITPAGARELRSSLKAYLREPERILSEFDLSITLICHLDKDSAMESLDAHRAELERDIAQRKETLNELKKGGVLPYTGLIRRRHFLYKREAELKTIRSLIMEMETDTGWKHFPGTDLRML